MSVAFIEEATACDMNTKISMSVRVPLCVGMCGGDVVLCVRVCGCIVLLFARVPLCVCSGVVTELDVVQVHVIQLYAIKVYLIELYVIQVCVIKLYAIQVCLCFVIEEALACDMTWRVTRLPKSARAQISLYVCALCVKYYGVSTISRLLKIIGLFCKRDL